MKINEMYKEKEIFSQMQEFFESEGFIQLNDFLKNENLKEIVEKIKKSKLTEKYNPLIIRKKVLKKEDTFDVEILKLYEFFSSKEFLEYIEDLTELELILDKINLNVYSQKDFILLNDKTEKNDCIEVIFDISDNWHENYGGFLTYTTKEEEIFYLEPTFNTLTILFKPEEIMRYLKYINCLSEDKKIIRLEIEYKMKEI